MAGRLGRIGADQIRQDYKVSDEKVFAGHLSFSKAAIQLGIHQLFFDEWASRLRKRLKGFFSRNGRDEPVVVPRLLGFGGLFHLE
jgi:hypothetical protein